MGLSLPAQGLVGVSPRAKINRVVSDFRKCRTWLSPAPPVPRCPGVWQRVGSLAWRTARMRGPTPGL
eukprot:2643222-Alexandrium_andersonii.AAC.1